MFGISLPSVSDVKNAVTSTVSSAVHTTEDLGSAAVSHAASLGRSGLDLGRKAVSSVSHLDVQQLGGQATAAIGKAETWTEGKITTGVMAAGKGVHAAADYARSHVTGGDPLSRLARGAITVTEDQTRFDIGVVGGVGKAAVGLAGSAGQLGVLATEYQVSPSAHRAIDAKIGGALMNGASSVVDYASSVARDPARVVGDAQSAASAGEDFVVGRYDAARQAVAEGHGPESFGMVTGNAATYLVPVGGEVRVVAEAGEVGTRTLVRGLAEDGTRTLATDGAKVIAEAPKPPGALSIPPISDIARAGVPGAAQRTGLSEAEVTRILETPKGARPATDTYLSEGYRGAALSRFDDGAIRITSKSNLAKYGSLGPPQGAFVLPARDFADIAEAANGDLRVIEQKLSLQDGQLSDGDTVVALLERDQLNHLALPTGNEAGANEHWLPGAVTAGGVPEGVVDFQGRETYRLIPLEPK